MQEILIEARTTAEQYRVGHVIRFVNPVWCGKVDLTNVCTMGAVVYRGNTLGVGLVRSIAVLGRRSAGLIYCLR